ncbi:hypothetical protein [Streptomyces longispororuber]|uniref:hypothetical protein n=1 Tax=Streptomyces longispororuber TaxID=68230 RepID=UPI00210E36CE|nr:hypothetical protein [Streptomyces longispororuber]MCQ4209415.1 hypothetical protein [Streptomyces longispororuber]
MAALLGMALGEARGGGTDALLRGSADLAPYVKGWLLLPSAGALFLVPGLTVLLLTAVSVVPARGATRKSPTEAMKGW